MNKIVLFLFFLTPLLSGTTGKVKGQVVDAVTKEPLTGCVIYLAETEYGTAVDNDGNYFILNVKEWNIQPQSDCVCSRQN